MYMYTDVHGCIGLAYFLSSALSATRKKARWGEQTMNRCSSVSAGQLLVLYCSLGSVTSAQNLQYEQWQPKVHYMFIS